MPIGDVFHVPRAFRGLDGCSVPTSLLTKSVLLTQMSLVAQFQNYMHSIQFLPRVCFVSAGRDHVDQVTSDVPQNVRRHERVCDADSTTNRALVLPSVLLWNAL